ncbi:MAG: ComEC/Rec2 family competence protein [Candidatus Omnitrophica bacterium]|nr:ComEC/Rec2 family competence protein [Candidatus Omnitrophota bacterium]MDE2010431.1 ComEC/Rec2 family competence protein [Candidatus Omnitrophota bacterium]MDE2215441.1 ComEC/Rec2 family competence protein [Candidatus Omnitrophota bacterium]
MKGPHRPACGLAVVLSSGILIGHFLPLELFFWLVASSLFILLFLFRPRTWPVYAGIFCLGAALIHVAHPPSMDILAGWRGELRQVLYRYLDDTEAGTMAAIVLGDRRAIPKEINMIFRHTGTGHILVIAGLHMAMMALMVVFILKLIRIPRAWQVFLSIFLILMYAVLTGGPVPVVRAAVMAAVLLASSGAGFESDALNSLGLAALILLLMNAGDFFDASFQLSFAAVFAIIVLYIPLEKRLSFCPRWLAAALSVSTAAWIGITPFQIWHFGTIAPVALIANLFVVPLLELTVALGVGLVLAGLGLPGLAWSLAGCLKAVFNLMVVVAFWFSRIPYGYIQLWQVHRF